MSSNDLNEKQRKHGRALGASLAAALLLISYAYHQAQSIPLVLLFVYVFGSACVGMGIGWLVAIVTYMRPTYTHFLPKIGAQLIRGLAAGWLIFGYIWAFNVVVGLWIMVMDGFYDREQFLANSLRQLSGVWAFPILGVLGAMLHGAVRLFKRFKSSSKERE